MRTWTMLLFLSAALLLTACGGAASSFVVEGAAAPEPGRFETIRQAYETGENTLDDDWLMTAHRIGEGDGTVFAWRISELALIMDSNMAEKLTIFLPGDMPAAGATIRFGTDAEPPGAVAVFTDHSPSPIAPRCVAVASGGTMRIVKSGWGRVVADLDLRFGEYAEDDWRYCYPWPFEMQLSFRNKSLHQLSAWEGRAAGPTRDAEWWPQEGAP